MHRWEQNPSIEILGNHDLPRLSIVSFVIRHDERYVHHEAVVALLNDLFGIQSRGGCSCAGPYGHRLLGIDLDTSHAFEREIARGCEGIKPGLGAGELQLLPHRRRVRLRAGRGRSGRDAAAGSSCPGTGSIRPPGVVPRDGQPEPPMSLTDVRYDDHGLRFESQRHHEGEDRLLAYLDVARDPRSMTPLRSSGRRPGRRRGRGLRGVAMVLVARRGQLGRFPRPRQERRLADHVVDLARSIMESAVSKGTHRICRSSVASGSAVPR